MTEEDWNALPSNERMKLGAGRCRTDEARAKAANIRLEDWMKLSDKQKNYADVERLWTWKACGELEGTDMTEEEWNALPLKERMKLGVARAWTWKACGHHLVGEGMTEEEWNALPLDERMKRGVARVWTWKACGELEGTDMTEEDWNALPLNERMKLGMARMYTWEVCGPLVGEGMTEEDWNALTSKERMKRGGAANISKYHNGLWNRRYGELCQFKIDNEHWQVPRENKQLKDWVKYQKKAYKNGTMSLECKKLLDEIGDFSGDDGMKGVLGGMLDKHTGGSQVIPEFLDELDVTEDSFTSNDVLFVKSGNGGNGAKNLPGNLRLQVAISNHMSDDPTASGEQLSSLSKLVIDEIESLVPPGRFLEVKPGNRCFRTLNRTAATANDDRQAATEPFAMEGIQDYGSSASDSESQSNVGEAEEEESNVGEAEEDVPHPRLVPGVGLVPAINPAPRLRERAVAARSDQPLPPYRMEVLGRRVAIVFNSPHGRSVQRYYYGTVQNYTMMHGVRFDDGEVHWFDLASVEDDDLLRWPGRRTDDDL
jgi:hypothetical protein